MGITYQTEAEKLSAHLRDLREARHLTLAALAAQSGISRASLTRIENAKVSPTAETLGRLASVYALPISQLLAPLEPDFQPLVRHQDQSIWQDPQHDFLRRIVSPSNGQLSLELIEGRLGPGQKIAYPTPALPGQEHHVLILSGRHN